MLQCADVLIAANTIMQLIHEFDKSNVIPYTPKSVVLVVSSPS